MAVMTELSVVIPAFNEAATVAGVIRGHANTARSLVQSFAVRASALAVMWGARDGAALVVGRRIPRRDTRSRVLVAELYSAGLRALFGLPVHDVDSVKLYRASELRAAAPRSATNFMEAEILVTLHRRGAVIREVPIEHRPRIAGPARGVTFGSAAQAIIDLGLFLLADLIGGRRRQR
jgi:hypothetical protein